MAPSTSGPSPWRSKAPAQSSTPSTVSTSAVSPSASLGLIASALESALGDRRHSETLGAGLDLVDQCRAGSCGEIDTVRHPRILATSARSHFSTRSSSSPCSHARGVPPLLAAHVRGRIVHGSDVALFSDDLADTVEVHYRQGVNSSRRISPEWMGRILILGFMGVRVRIRILFRMSIACDFDYYPYFALVVCT